MVTVKNEKDLSHCKVYEFKADSARLFNENKGADSEQIQAVLRVEVQDVPEDIWMDTNLRERNYKTAVAKAIHDSLILSSTDNFHLLNRGILISAYHIEIVEKKGVKYVRLYLKEKSVHGNVDGGHTYSIICNNKKNIEFKKRVTIEVMTGIEEYFEELAAARNTSVQVQDKSKAELENKFNIIKEAIKEKRYASDIAYKENQAGLIDITEIVAILTMFNLKRFNDKNHEFPTASYSRKSACVNWYIKDYADDQENPYYKMQNVIKDIFKLYDLVEASLPVFYNAKGGKYGKISGVSVSKKGYQRLFADEEVYQEHSSPNGFIYPIVGAFRYLLIEDKQTGFYKWRTEPCDMFMEIGPDLVSTVVEAHRSLGNNPNATGKFLNLWNQLYDKVKISYFESLDL
ncbi:AIPR family protein [Bacillus cereus]|uniref:AIPR family protein n=1 Tax=Bacillus cereus TaxID=1396 RepID=UPI0014830266|nr:AIPR family protein [Bacillus cereus]